MWWIPDAEAVAWGDGARQHVTRSSSFGSSRGHVAGTTAVVHPAGRRVHIRGSTKPGLVLVKSTQVPPPPSPSTLLRHHRILSTAHHGLAPPPLLPSPPPRLPPPAAGRFQWPSCGKNGNFTTNSAYQANIRALSVTLPNNASSSPTLFAVAAVGTRPDTVYALALCRGDANASACGDCVSTGFADAQKLCPYSKAATVYYDLCYVGFSSNQTFLSATTGGDNGAIILTNQQNVTAPVEAFDAAVGALINATVDYAAENSSRRFATGEEGFQTVDEAKPKIYGLAQCRPDMAPADCRSCLADIITNIPKYMSGKQGGRILGLRCNYRYEQYPFYTGPSLLQLPAPSIGAAPAQAPAPTPVNATPAPVPPTQVNATPGSPPPPGGGSTGNGAARILAITLPIVAAILACVVI
ncbi:hypothetical protein ACQ4PT_056931 [Festuca glaucescens]